MATSPYIFSSQRLGLLCLGFSILVGCSPRGLSSNPSAAVSRQTLFSKQSTASKNLDLTDNFTRYIRNKIREEGFKENQDSEPILGTPVKALPRSTGSKALTYMTYEALDNNLSSDLNRIVDTLETVGSNSQMNLIAQTDNYGAGNAARYFLQRNAAGDIQSPYIALGSQGESSGNPTVFSNAVKWGFGSYPSRYKWLNISTHGMGFSGINYDDDPEQSMNIIDFNRSLASGLQGDKLDLISFDACLMATIEVASELKDTSKILIGSEDSTYYWGHGYQTTFSRLAADPVNMNPSQVARSLVVDVNNKGTGNQTLTISATDLTKVASLEKELNTLAVVLRAALPTHKASIIRAVQATREFHMAEGIPFRDINRMMALLKRYVDLPEMVQIADRINHVMYREGVILFSRQSKVEAGEGRGLSIYLPSEGHVSQVYRQTRFAKETQWDEFLIELNQQISAG